MVIKRKFTPNKREFEGQMNYSAYLQSGGILDQAPKELVELVIKALEGDQESGKSLSAFIQQNPEAEGIVQQIAEALTSNSSPAAMKCGGRVQKAEGGDKVNLPSIKTRKLEGKELSFVESTSAGRTRIDEYKDKEGNKYRYAEFTDHKGDVHKEYIFNGKKHKSEELHEEDMKKFTKSTKKAERGLKIGDPKCGCALKKVGGRLIEVDSCTGLPTHRNGDKIQYAKFGDGIKKFFNNFANAANRSGANFTPGAGSIAGSIVDGTPSGIVGSPAQKSTGNNGVEDQNNRMSYQTFNDWLKENAPEYLDQDKRSELFHKYGMGSIPMYQGSSEQNLALWEKMKRDKSAGVAFGGPEQAKSAQVPLVSSASAPAAPQITLPASAQLTPDQIRENAIAKMAGKRISDRERAKWGSAYDAITSGANPTQMSQRDLARVQRMGRVLRMPAAKQGGQLNYADYLN